MSETASENVASSPVVQVIRISLDQIRSSPIRPAKPLTGKSCWDWPSR